MSLTQVLRNDLGNVMDHLPVVVFEYTFYPDGRRGFTYISPRCEELLDLRPDEIVEGHLSIDRYIHPDDLECFQKSVEESVREVKGWSWKGRARGRGGYQWIEVKSTPTRKSDGTIVQYGIFSDITESKKLEAHSALTDNRYRNLVEQLPLGIVIFSGGFIRFANQHAARLIGAESPADLIGSEGFRFIHPDHVEAVRSRVQTALEGKPVPLRETKFVRLDGSELIVESVGFPYVYEGEPAMQVIFTDITERKRAEAGYQRTETLFFELFQNSPLAIVLLNERSEVVQLNRGFERLFGFTYNDLVGKTLTDAIVPSELEQEGDEINNHITANKVIRVETVRHRKGGGSVPVIIYGVPVMLRDEKIGIFGMYVDITERKRVEEELKIRNAELDNFVYKVSHDLRAPLSSVLGLAHLAAMPGNRDDLSEYVKLMGEKAMQLDHFISDVLSHSKNLKMDVTVDLVDMHELIAKTFDDLNFLAGTDEIERIVEVKGEELFSDRWRLGEVFRNLLSNAIKYRRTDGERPLVKVIVRVTRHHCEIDVSDNGIGVESALVPRIFEMFFRASDRSDGSGLGLYIVRNAIERLSGTIDVQSEAGVGTRFTIRIPNLIPK